jgi:hypothetical protein
MSISDTGLFGLSGLMDQSLIGGGGAPGQLDFSAAANSMFVPLVGLFL